MAKKKPYRYPLYLLARLGAGMVYLLPRRFTLWLAGQGGRLGYYLVSRHRETTLANLRHAFRDEKTDAEIQNLAVRVFENAAKAAVEVIQLPKYRASNFDRIINTREAWHLYDRLLAEGKGLLLLTAHIGNWELLGGAINFSGTKGYAIGRRLRYEPYNRWIINLRKSVDTETIYRDESARRIVEALKRNLIVGILPDQDIDSLKGIFIPFFGRPAYTSIAPVRLSLMTGAPIVPSYIIREKCGRYVLEVGNVIRPVIETTREEAIEKYTRLWMQDFERVIRRYPEQWSWMHNRWKTQPETIKQAAFQAAG